MLLTNARLLLAHDTDISKWNLPQVTTMTSMFHNAESFDDDASKWDVSHVTHMTSMFNGATSLDIDASMWKVPHVIAMEYMFYGTTSFNTVTACSPYLEDIGKQS